MQQLWRKCLLLSALAVTAGISVPSYLYSQQLSATRGGLGGVITDKSGAIIPDAKVTVTGASDHRVVTTDSAGRFTASDLTPGMYTVEVEKAGFQKQTAKNLEVVINRTQSVDFSLATGNVAETVEVNATTVSIDTSSTAVSDNLTATFYQQVPIARNIGSLFYVSPGVVDGGLTGTSNPSVGGATGLENLYLVDGVVLNDSGYGGLGVFSPVYGSLGTGINLSFIQEVQVKTAAYEPKYGGVNGGVLQIVTKSGGTKLHGAVAAYMAPAGAGAGYYYQDNARTFAGPGFQRGKVFSQPAYDASVELGGYIPVKGHNDRLFFFGSFNPSLNQINFIAPNTPFASAVYNHGPFTSSATTRSWAGKLSAKVTDGTTIDLSAFGDPAHNNYSFNGVGTVPYPNIQLKNTTSFSTWNYGSRAVVAHLASSLNPTTQLNLAATYKTSNFTEAGFDNIPSISDRTNGVAGFQGLGIYQNPENKSYGATIDIQKVANLFGPHTFSGGFGFGRATYLVARDYSGPRFAFPSTNADGVAIQDVGGNDALVGAQTSCGVLSLKGSGGLYDRIGDLSTNPLPLLPGFEPGASSSLSASGAWFVEQPAGDLKRELSLLLCQRFVGDQPPRHHQCRPSLGRGAAQRTEPAVCVQRQLVSALWYQRRSICRSQDQGLLQLGPLHPGSSHGRGNSRAESGAGYQFRSLGRALRR